MKHKQALIIIGSLILLGMGFRFIDIRPKFNNDLMEESPILGLRTCIYMVSDLQKAKEWYSLAFQKEPYFDEPFYVGFDIGGFELGLQPSDKSISEKSENVLTYWGVEEIELEYNKLLSLGAIEHEKPNNVGGEIMVASLKDPWGNIIGIIYNPHYK